MKDKWMAGDMSENQKENIKLNLRKKKGIHFD